jgi:L-asparaginase
MTQSKSSVLLIYTGGTIGMKEDPGNQTLKPFDFSSLMEEVPELHKFALRIDSYTFDPLIDSSDIEPSMWQKLAEIIRDNYNSYDGFVVLHGTDTMAYSASALSFMLENLSKPVIFTGSQLPIGRPRTDGKENLISAVEIASAREPDGTPTVPEVCIYFNSLLLRGNRCTKVDATGFEAFRSPNLPPLAEAGIDIRYNRDIIRRTPPGPFRIHTRLDTSVSILKVHPGITRQVVEDILLGSRTRAVIIESYGCGNAPSSDWFLDIVRESNARGKILYNVTQCIRGLVNMDLYATGRTLKDAGVLGGKDITTESALGKLFFLMGNSDDNESVKAYLEYDLRGEMSN